MTQDTGLSEPARGITEPASAAQSLQLLAEVAHDVRSPLTSILFLVEALRAGHSGRVNERQRRQLALIYTATFALNNLVDDLTELAQGGGLSLLEREPICFSLGRVCETVCDLVLPVVEERGVELRVDHRVADARMGHPAALTRVLLNLVTNALRVTTRGSVTIATAERGGDDIGISVADTGPGISADAMTSLFQPLESRGRERRGISTSGLGLAISRRIVREMGGTIDVESTVGVGSRFHVTLPLPRAPAECEAENPGPEEPR